MRYHLDIRDGENLIEDWEGAEHSDLDGAIHEALAGARQMLAECLRCGLPMKHRVFEIRDEEGLVVHVLPFENAILA